MRWWRRKERERDLERELLSHLELEAEERRDAGLPPDQARDAAQRAFGNTVWCRRRCVKCGVGHPWSTSGRISSMPAGRAADAVRVRVKSPVQLAF
jgi:hypothetical protein